MAPARHFPYPWGPLAQRSRVRSAENGPPPLPDEALAAESSRHAIYANDARTGGLNAGPASFALIWNLRCAISARSEQRFSAKPFCTKLFSRRCRATISKPREQAARYSARLRAHAQDRRGGAFLFIHELIENSWSVELH
jgi:hypothetical protein